MDTAKGAKAPKQVHGLRKALGCDGLLTTSMARQRNGVPHTSNIFYPCSLCLTQVSESLFRCRPIRSTTDKLHYLSDITAVILTIIQLHLVTIHLCFLQYTGPMPNGPALPGISFPCHPSEAGD